MASLDSDVALIGTGLAPLVAARKLTAQGKSVVVLNPDRDFFLEDSELPLEPLQGMRSMTPELVARIARATPERALAELQPEFPGSVEAWPLPPGREGFHDPEAPHVRARSGIWLAGGADGAAMESIDELYLQASEAGLKPQILEGPAAVARFPGNSVSARGSTSADQYESARGVIIPKLCDVDVSRYRNGLLEFVRERLGPERVLMDVAQLELVPGGVRFHAASGAGTARLRSSALVFWTPRLTAWVMTQLKRYDRVVGAMPRGTRGWEEWLITSRDAIDPTTIGMRGRMIAWAEATGRPDDPGARKPSIHRLAILRPGETMPLRREFTTGPASFPSWASSASLEELGELCSGFLRWERFSIRAMKPREILDWDGLAPSWTLGEGEATARIIPRSDGAVVEVAACARAACERWVPA